MLPDQRMVCLSCSEQPGFIFSLVVAALGWRRIGYRVGVGLVSDTRHMLVAAAATTCRLLGFEVVVRRASQYTYPIDRFEYGKLLRWDLARELPQDRCLTVLGDADMIRLEPLVSVPHKWDELISWGANLYEGEPFYPRYPVCYLGGQPEAWWALGQFSEADIRAGRANGVVSDEMALKAMLARHPRPIVCVARNRERMQRVGRADWPTTRTLAGSIDAHLPREAWRPAGWPMYRRLLATVFNADDMGIIETHRENVLATVREYEACER